MKKWDKIQAETFDKAAELYALSKKRHHFFGKPQPLGTVFVRKGSNKVKQFEF